MICRSNDTFEGLFMFGVGVFDGIDARLGMA
jgi:hypothetical protein